MLEANRNLTRIYIDLDGVMCDYNSSLKEHLKNCPENQYPQSKMDFFRKLKPIENAIDSYTWLECLGFDVRILSAPSTKNPLSYTEKRLWVEDHLGMSAVDKMILTKDKSIAIGDYLIDDYDKGYGQDKFQGELIHFGSDKFKDWKSVLEYLKIKLEISERIPNRILEN